MAVLFPPPSRAAFCGLFLLAKGEGAGGHKGKGREGMGDTKGKGDMHKSQCFDLQTEFWANPLAPVK